MSAYDNPTIIKDMYGMEAWGNFAKTVADSVGGVFDAMKANREKQAAIVAADDKLYTKSLVEAEIKQTTDAFKNFSKMEKEGELPGYIEQAKRTNEYEMYGGWHSVEDRDDTGEVVMVKKDFGIGSIKAAALTKSDLDLDPELRKKYLQVVFNQKDSLKNSAKEAAVVLSDEPTVNQFGSNPKVYFVGENAQEKYTNYLASRAVYNKAVGGGVEYNKIWSKDEIKGKPNSIMGLDIKIPIGSTQAKLYTDDYIKDNDNIKVIGNNIVINWERNLTDGSWDGNFANESTIDGLDYDTLNKDNGSIVNGKLGEQYQVELTGDKTLGDTMDQNEVLTFVNVPGFTSNNDKLFQARADVMANMALTGSAADRGDVAHYLKSLKYMGIDYQKEYKEGRITEEGIADLFKDYIQKDQLTHFNLGQELDQNEFLMEGEGDSRKPIIGENGKPKKNPEFGKFVNQKVNGLALQKRVITQDQIDELASKNVDISNIKANTEQYFYVNNSSANKKTDDTNTETLNALEKEQKTWNAVVNGEKIGNSVRKPQLYFAFPRKVPNTSTHIQFIDGSYYEVVKDSAGTYGKKGDAYKLEDLQNFN